MSIHIVIPTVRTKQIFELLEDICIQTVIPDKITIVDNSKEKIDRKLLSKFPLNIEILDFGKNLGPNAVWNLILSEEQDYDYVGFGADDYRLNPYLFEKLVAVLERNKKVGVVCPIIIEKAPLPKEEREELSWISVHGKGNSSIVLIPKDIAIKIPKIPEELFVFFGDNWISHFILTVLGLHWVRLCKCFIHHNSTTGVSGKMKVRSALEHERKSYHKIIEDIKNK